MTDAWNSKCKKCGSPNSYEGFSGQECPTEGCDNFSAKQKMLVQKEFDEQEEAQRAYEYRDAQNNQGPEEEEEEKLPASLELDLDDPAASQADTEPPPGPPDDLDDPYIWGLYGPPASKPSSRKAIAPPKPPEEKADDPDSYFPYELPSDMTLD